MLKFKELQEIKLNVEILEIIKSRKKIYIQEVHIA